MESLRPRGGRSAVVVVDRVGGAGSGAADPSRQAHACGGADVLPGPERSALVLLRERQTAPFDGRQREAAVLLPPVRGERALGVGPGRGAGGRGGRDRARGGGAERDEGADRDGGPGADPARAGGEAGGP